MVTVERGREPRAGASSHARVTSAYLCPRTCAPALMLQCQCKEFGGSTLNCLSTGIPSQLLLLFHGHLWSIFSCRRIRCRFD
eukprot:3800117-Pleurochrysis_carterae.AAC.2